MADCGSLCGAHGVKIRRGLIFYASFGPIHHTDSDSTNATAGDRKPSLSYWDRVTRFSARTASHVIVKLLGNMNTKSPRTISAPFLIIFAIR